MSNDKEFDELEKQVNHLKVGVIRKKIGLKNCVICLITAVCMSILTIAVISALLSPQDLHSGLATAGEIEKPTTMSAGQGNSGSALINKTRVNWVKEENEGRLFLNET